MLSSRTKAKTWSPGTGSQMEVAALRTTPLGWPGSALRCEDTRTLTSVVPDSSVHRCSGDELRLAQKLLTIRCDSFIMLRFPSGVTAHYQRNTSQLHALRDD
jgi:hypothetical protein